MRSGRSAWLKALAIVAALVMVGVVIILDRVPPAAPVGGVTHEQSDPPAFGAASSTPSTGLASPDPTVSPSSSSAASHAPSPSTPPTPSPAATVPASLERSATVEQDGLRVTIRLDETPLRAGVPAWITKKVTNLGDEAVVWSHGGCVTTVNVLGTMDERPWRPGIAHEGIAAELKEWLISDNSLNGMIYIDFRHEELIGAHRGGCSDIGDGSRLRPGESITQRAQWNGSMDFRLGDPPSGPLHLKGSFRDYHRPAEGRPRDSDAGIEIRLDTWVIDGRDPDLLDPPEVIDAALASPEFSAWLETRNIGNANDPAMAFDEDAGLWEVGLLEYDTRTYYVARVHPRTGQVIDIIRRPWDDNGP